MSNAFVCILGVSTVFVGLICLILLVYLVGAICKLFGNKTVENGSVANAPAVNQADSGVIANKQEILAGVCAVIAEELGTDVKNIKVVSFKKA